MSQYRSQRFRVERVPSGISYPAKRIYTPKAKKSTLALPKNITFDENEDSLGLPEAQANAASSFMSSTPTWRSEHASPSPLPSNQLQPPSPPAMLYLPVLRVDVKVSVDGTVAHTTLVQHFHNDFDNPIPKASYTFPLYDGAVVTSFRYKAQDKELVGQVKPKEQARQEFERARETKKAAALLEEHTPEIFETVVGNIPANTTVEVHIMYVGELRAHVLQQHDMPNKLDVVIPVSIAPRYGSPSRGDMTSTVPQGGGLNIRIEVNDNGTIQNLTSPTHGDAVSVKKVEPESITVASFALLAEEATVTQQVATYSSPLMTMNGDFVLTIEANPQYLLRSRAVLSGPNENGHAALMVNIKPRDIFEYDFRPENFAGEIIFLLDRSGSMGYGGGLDSLETVTKIGTLRPAMNLALASLPEHCVFNIASFGTDCEFLWQESQQHSKENISYARRYVYKDVRANMGSTEMLFALQEVVKSRLEDRPSTQIIIVTDGELEDDGITSFVFKTHQAHQDRIRFFALGIGEEVSHRLIEDIGEFGGGYGEVINIKKKPQWEGHLMRMLRLGLAPSRWIYDISFGSGFERRSLREYRLGQNPKDKETVSYIQAPYPTPAFHPFSYRSLFFLFQVGLTKKLPPTKIMLKPRNTGSKAGAQHTLQVEPTWTDRSTIHHLAVKAALIDLEAEASRENTLVAQSDIGRQNAELLGKMYSIASKWTGFVAVDQKTESSAIVDIYKADLIDVDLDDLEASIEADEASGDSSSDDHVPGAFRPIVPAPTISKNIFDQVSVSQDVEPQCLRPPRPGHHPLRPGPQQIPVRMPEPKSELPQTNPTPPPPSPPPPPVLQKPAPKPEPKPEMRHELPPSRPPPPPPVQKPQPNPALPYGVFFPPPPPPAAVQKPKPPVSAQDQINLEEHGLYVNRLFSYH
ncbi:hypothetical protein BHE90_010297 [Fusarium euwallaceae]|uniref:VIT domain-containing protein n=2 Tax=Fusarium solani species complex TaxID=232080 RepID=A0A3M2RQZ7_9HYPO|nr:hypothetical protein CDV36_012655 [Fusarium kuroshium]RTE75254.1 hypothetical protein BHE90_010297 [Fusarium euwallaceae]